MFSKKLFQYFPRLSVNPKSAVPLKALQSVSEMRDLTTQAILGDYSANKYSDWPDFNLLGK